MLAADNARYLAKATGRDKIIATQTALYKKPAEQLVFCFFSVYLTTVK